MQPDDAMRASAVSAPADVHQRNAQDAVTRREVPSGMPAGESAPPLDQRLGANLKLYIPFCRVEFLTPRTCIVGAKSTYMTCHHEENSNARTPQT